MPPKKKGAKRGPKNITTSEAVGSSPSKEEQWNMVMQAMEATLNCMISAEDARIIQKDKFAFADITG